VISLDTIAAFILPPPLRGRVGEGGMPHDEVGKIQRARAKQLRRTMTRAETLLWRHKGGGKTSADGARLKPRDVMGKL
jgi:very-short-patch-repair endonuclease